jgi:predicted nucleic acid-binding protein
MTLVFDAEPLLALFLDEPGADRVRQMLERVAEGSEEAWISVVNLAEIASVLTRKAPGARDELIAWILAAGVRAASADTLWPQAGWIKGQNRISLADAFALATAQHLGAELVVRRDPHFLVASSLGIRLRHLG